MKRRILLVDDEVAVLLTLKAVLEISGFEVDTAASGREGVSRLHTHEYHMLITDMRMEHDESGIEVIRTARSAPYRPAVALLTAFPVADEDWQEMGADKLLVKPTQTRILLEQIENLFDSHEKKLAAQPAPAVTKTRAAAPKATKKAALKRPVAAKTSAVKKSAVKKVVRKPVKPKAAAAKKTAAKKSPAKPRKRVTAAAKKAVKRPRPRA